MKIRVILNGVAGELANETVEITDLHDDESEAVSIAAHSVIERWTLSVDDTITITEITP